MDLPDRVKLPFQFSETLMLQDLEALDQVDWIDHFVKMNYDGDWSVIPLTAQRGREHPILMASAVPGNDDFVSTPYLKLCPYLQQILDEIKTDKQSVRLMKLTAGSEIKEHRDYDLDIEAIRLHIPIRTHEDVHFYVNNNEVKMIPGECWYLRLSDPHSVVNDSTIHRVHLVIDVKLNEWMKDQLIEASSKAN